MLSRSGRDTQEPTNATGEQPEFAPGLREGDILAGKYRLERVLGAGGMGIVVAARHAYLDERVAIKFLNQALLGNPEIVARFAQEARAAVRIKSEHVARVMDVGVMESGAPYMVMEYLEGGDLSDWLEKRGTLSVEFAVDFVLQACEALAEAHRLGIVHRDLKPSNLFWMRRSDGRYHIKVLDFGISKALAWETSQPDMGMTKTNSVMGSPLYMSPEHMQSAKSVDIRTDLWSLGVILYELLAGQPPFRGTTITEVCSQVISQNVPPLASSRADAPTALEQVIGRCLEKDREKRYANVAELAHALAPFAPKRAHPCVERISLIVRGGDLADAPDDTSVLGERQTAVVLSVEDTSAPLSQTVPGLQRSRAIPIMVSLAALGAAIWLGSALLRTSQPRPVASTPASMPLPLQSEIPDLLSSHSIAPPAPSSSMPMPSAHPADSTAAVARATEHMPRETPPRTPTASATASKRDEAPATATQSLPSSGNVESAARPRPTVAASANAAISSAPASATSKWGGRR